MIKYLLILLLVTGSVNAQQLPGSFLSPNPGARGVTYNGLKALREFYLPQYDTTYTPSWEGAIVYRMDDQTPYIYRGAKWQVVGGFYTDSAARVAVGGSYRAKWFGILGNGTDQTALINSTLSSLPIGSTLEFEPNTTYKAASKIIIPKSVRLLFNNATVDYTGTGIAISIQSSDVEIGWLQFRGQANDYIAFAEAISTEGSTNTSFYRNINIHHCNLSNYHSKGILLKYVTGFKINDNFIRDFAYAGIMTLSCTYGDISVNNIKNITQGTAPDSYGIAATKSGVLTDTISHDITINRNQIDSVLRWEGIDTHGGNNMLVTNNIITNTRNLISLVALQSLTDGNSSPTFVISGNVGNNEFISGSKAGITVQGDTIHLANGTITANVIYGSYILLQNTQGVVVNANALIRPYLYAIYQKTKNFGTIISNNTIWDVWRTGINSDAVAILQSADNGTYSNSNGAFISGNVLLRGSRDTTGVTINKYGFLNGNSADPTNKVTFGLNDFTAATVDQYHNNNDPTYVIGTGTPTAVQPNGSLFINKNGSSGSTFYITESGVWGSFLSTNYKFGWDKNFNVIENPATTHGYGIYMRGYDPSISINSLYTAATDGSAYDNTFLKAGTGITSGTITDLFGMGIYGVRHDVTPSTVIFNYIGAGSDVSYTNNNLRLYADKSSRFTGALAVGVGQSLSNTLKSSAVLQVDASDKGFLPPRMTSAEGNAIPSPAFGLMYVNRTRQSIRMYDSVQVKWRRVLSGDSTIIIDGMQPIGRTSTGDFAMAVPTGTSGVIVTPSSGGLNYKADTALMATNAQLQHRLDSLSATLIKTGQAFISGDGTSSFYDITLPTTPTWIGAPNPANAGSINISYALPITNGIRIYWSTPPLSGTNNIAVFYSYK